MNDSELAKRVIRHVNQPNYRPVKPRVIAKQLKLSKEMAVQLKREIKRLVKKGKLKYASNHLVLPADGKVGSGEVVGVFRRATAGYGFVRPIGTRREAGRDDDIFIPANRTKDAASGDTVKVRARTRKSSKRPSPRSDAKLAPNRVMGEVLEIVERGTKQFVGTYEQLEEFGRVQIDGTSFPSPVIVGDPGAKQVQTGDKVVIELVKYPKAHVPGEGVITEVLGQRGQPGVDTLSVIREFSLPDRFPEAVLEAARAEADAFSAILQTVDSATPGDIGSHLPDGRRDLTNLVVITIDPKDARDFDDAISLELLENGHWRLGVHIADVSHFVRPGNALDREARDRATSIYLPDRVIPMLPEVISNHLASLQPDTIRFVKTAFIEYTPEGIRVATDFCSGAIRSRRRFSYEEVDQFLNDRPTWRVKLGPDVYTLLDGMHRLAMKLRKRRMENGSIELRLPEVKIDLDGDGKVCGAHRVENTESHQVIEEFMLAANEAVAERFKDDGLPCLRRIHAAPDPLKLENLTEFVREIGIDCESLESRFEIKRVLAEVGDLPLEPPVNYAVLRSMRKAVYSPEQIGHYALAIKDYCHFTSPIRRYPDLTIHRLMESVFQGQPKPQPVDHLASLGDHCSDREQRAESAERELIKLKLLLFLSDKVGESLDVVVTGVEEFGLFAQGIQLPAEGLIHIDTLPRDTYHYDGQTQTLTGHREDNSFRLGDLLRVEITTVDLERRELDYTLLKRLQPDDSMDDPFASSRRRKKSSERPRDRKKDVKRKNAKGKKKRGR